MKLHWIEHKYQHLETIHKYFFGPRRNQNTHYNILKDIMKKEYYASESK